MTSPGFRRRAPGREPGRADPAAAPRAARRRRAAGAGAALGLLLAAGPAAGDWRLGGDLRGYGFLVEDAGSDGTDGPAGQGLLRLKAQGPLPGGLTLEAHGLATAVAPDVVAARRVVTGSAPHFLDLQVDPIEEADLRVRLEMDRLVVTGRRGPLAAGVGRQAITWGVAYFWPALDLFAPFPPYRIDREYKPGVDAARAVLALGPLSELDVVGAVLGPDLRDDGSAGALLRWHLGPADAGLAAGWFHGDVVAGAFVTADVRGTGLRAEIAWTDSGAAEDAARDRAQFWRGSLGADRQLTPTLALTAEVAWNGFGAEDPAGYAAVAASDRVRRGEVNALGRAQAGAALAWQAHPLVEASLTVLVSLQDGSVLLLPRVDWSLSDGLRLEAGASAGLGPSADPGGRPESEYGAAGAVLYTALKLYW